MLREKWGAAKRTLMNLAKGAILWIQSRGEVAQFEGIILADLRNRRNQTGHFRETLLAALRLLKETDPCRFARVRRRLSWIVQTTLSPLIGAQYHHEVRTCAIDFIEPSPEYDSEYLIGCYACTLIHEATHGAIQSRGILSTPKLRSRIEYLCVREEQRFVIRLTLTQPALADRLYREFDFSEWEPSWRTTPAERLRRIGCWDWQKTSEQ
jgi:hypothetical protein